MISFVLCFLFVLFCFVLFCLGVILFCFVLSEVGVFSAFGVGLCSLVAIFFWGTVTWGFGVTVVLGSVVSWPGSGTGRV